jgi:hypothetical protein
LLDFVDRASSAAGAACVELRCVAAPIRIVWRRCIICELVLSGSGCAHPQLFLPPDPPSSSQLHSASPPLAEPSFGPCRRPYLCHSPPLSLSLFRRNNPAHSFFAALRYFSASPFLLRYTPVFPSRPSRSLRWAPVSPRDSVCPPRPHRTHATRPCIDPDPHPDRAEPGLPDSESDPTRASRR